MSENKISLRKEQVQLIEELSNLSERMGMQPAMGKIIALLTVNDDIELTFDQIKETLDLSKSAVSQALNQLLMIKKIGYKTKIGDRKRYFHLRIGDWEGQVMDMFEGLDTHLDIYKRILALRTPETKAFNNDLKNVINFMTFLNTEIASLYQKFLKQKKE